MAKWIKTSVYHGDDISGFIENIYKCSNCGQEAPLNEWFMIDLTDVCPHCKALMDEVTE